jgi:hypothetical protein
MVAVEGKTLEKEVKLAEETSEGTHLVKMLPEAGSPTSWESSEISALVMSSTTWLAFMTWV